MAAALAQWIPLASGSTSLSLLAHLCWFSFSQVSLCCKTIESGRNTWFTCSYQIIFSKIRGAPCNAARTSFRLWSLCFWFKREVSLHCSECCWEVSFARDCSWLQLRLGTFCHFLSVATRLCRWRPWNKCWFWVQKLFPFLDICQLEIYSEHLLGIFYWIRPFLSAYYVSWKSQLICSSKIYSNSKDLRNYFCKFGWIIGHWQITVAFAFHKF